MTNAVRAISVMGLLIAVAGCSRTRPAEYERQRPSVDSLDSRDRGLQSKDVVTASDQMARDLLATPKLRRSADQWVMVVDRFEDRTMDRRFATNYDIFIERLRTNLGRYGDGQVQLIENKAKLQSLRSKELDMPAGDQFGQGAAPSGMSRLQPDYALYGKAYDMPNLGTNYYMLEFVVTDLRSGMQVWTNQYEVKVAR